MTTDHRRARIAVAVAFVTHAAVFATWAPRIPTIKQSLGLTHDDLGIAFGSMAVGLLLGTRLTGRWEKRASTGKPIRVLMPLQCVALAGPAFAPNLPSLSLALFVLGVLGGVLDVAMNAHAVAVERVYGRPIMSAFHGLWSGGMMAGSAIASLVARYGVGVQVHFAVAGVVFAAVSAPLLAWLLTAEHEARAQAPTPAEAALSAAEDLRSRRRVGRTSLLIIGVLALVGFGGFLIEGAVMDWGAILLHEERGATESVAALGLTVFAGVMAVSRLAGDVARVKLGTVRLVRMSAAIGFVGLGAALVVEHPVATMGGFALLALGIGPLVPIAFSSAGNVPVNGRVSALSVAVSAGYVGAILGPMLIGFVAGRAGLTWGLTIPLAFVAGTVFLAGSFRELDRQLEPVAAESLASASPDPEAAGPAALQSEEPGV